MHSLGIEAGHDGATALRSGVCLRLFNDTVQTERVSNGWVLHTVRHALYARSMLLGTRLLLVTVRFGVFGEGEFRQGRAFLLHRDLRQLVLLLLFVVGSVVLQHRQLILTE